MASWVLREWGEVEVLSIRLTEWAISAAQTTSLVVVDVVAAFTPYIA